MNKELLIQFLSEAIDNGAEISIHMGQYNGLAPVKKDDALRFASMFKDAVGGEMTERSSEFCDSFNVRTDRFSAHISHSPVEKALSLKAE